VAITATLDMRIKADKLDSAFEVIHESWESPEADNAYRQWRATPEGASALGSILAAPPSLTLFTVAEGI
jgi:hypothetical protein